MFSCVLNYIFLNNYINNNVLIIITFVIIGVTITDAIVLLTSCCHLLVQY